MSPYEVRKKQILEALRIKKQITVTEASHLLDISPATTRRFFITLADDGYVIRTHGGIQMIPEVNGSYSYILSNTVRVLEKEKIAEYVKDLVNSRDLLFLDSGTTILKLSEALVPRLESGELTNLVVITNSLLNYERLAEYCKVILVGGEVRLNRRDTCGQFAENALKSLHVHKSFFGADAVHPEKGLMTTDDRTFRMNDIVRKNSEEVYVLADSEKFGKSSLMTYAGLTDVSLIITDSGISDENLARFRENGAKIQVVPMESS